ncbi:MAG: hypothetical protein Roseis2KO_21140 [Roseivirga sp.]
MKNPENLNKLAPLAEFIDSFYGGDLTCMRKELVEAILMFHYVNAESFGPNEVQNKCYILYQIAECFNE